MGTFDVAALKLQLEQTFEVSLHPPEPIDTGYTDWRELSGLLAALIATLDARVIAVGGSQGSGKTTLSEILTRACNQSGAGVVSCSIDDFYLCAADRAALAAEVHPLLRTRGVPGTHEWAWLQQTLDAVHAGAARLTLPVFDKGRDDRQGTIDVEARRLILEGWCLGVTTQPESQLQQPCNTLEAREDPDGRWRRYVNEQVRSHYQPLWRQVDLWVHLRVPSFAQVVAWRTQQEQQLPPEQRMSDAEILRFIQHYERLTRWIWSNTAQGPGVLVQLDESHRVAGITVSAGSKIGS